MKCRLLGAPTSSSLRILTCVTLALACAFVFFRAMDRDLNHDEHQFLAPAALLSREGLLPYRDYPLFHLPNLVFLYGALDRVTGRLLLSAKLLSAACTAAIVALCFLTATRRARAARPLERWLFGCGALVLFLSDPLTVFSACGKTWNHELPAFLTVAALLCHLAAARRDSLLCMAASGVAIGLAIGTRLTFAPLAVPFALFPLLQLLPMRRRLAHSATFTLATIAACAPSLWFLFTDREAFLFGNLEFPRLRLLDPENTRIRQTMTWWRKVRYFAKEIIVPSWPLFLGYIVLGVRPGWAWLRRRGAGGQANALLLCVLPFVLLGCFAPSRYQYQHYFIFAPLLVLGVVFGATSDPGANARRRIIAVSLAAVSLLSLLITSLREEGAASFAWLGRIGRPAEWFPAKMRSLGLAIHQLAPTGKVLTLAPTWVLEGGGRIYPEFATGPFAWRSAEFAAPERRRGLKLVAPADLEAFLQNDPPAAILTGVEAEKLEKPLIAWAQAHGFRAEPLSKKRTLWLPPSSSKEHHQWPKPEISRFRGLISRYGIHSMRSL